MGPQEVVNVVQLGLDLLIRLFQVPLQEKQGVAAPLALHLSPNGLQSFQVRVDCVLACHFFVARVVFVDVVFAALLVKEQEIGVGHDFFEFPPGQDSEVIQVELDFGVRKVESLDLLQVPLEDFEPVGPFHR